MRDGKVRAIVGGNVCYKMWSVNYDGYLIIARTEQSTLEGEILYLSADGEDFDFSHWHEGPCEGGVYVEVRRENGRWAHGWVDAESRRVVQVG